MASRDHPVLYYLNSHQFLYLQVPHWLMVKVWEVFSLEHLLERVRWRILCAVQISSLTPLGHGASTQSLQHWLRPSPSGHHGQLCAVSIAGSLDSARLTLSMALGVHVRIGCLPFFILWWSLQKWLRLDLCPSLPENAASETRQWRMGIESVVSILFLLRSLRDPKFTISPKIRVVREGKRIDRNPLL
jgi:hypothetical protein